MNENIRADLAEFALRYGASGHNHPDTFWLSPAFHTEMTYINDRMTWRYVGDDVTPRREAVAAALLWTIPQDIKQITVTVNTEDAGRTSVFAVRSHSAAESTRRWKDCGESHSLPLVSRKELGGGKTELVFDCDIDYLCKIYVLLEDCRYVPGIRAYGSAVWEPEETFCVLSARSVSLTLEARNARNCRACAPADSGLPASAAVRLGYIAEPRVSRSRITACEGGRPVCTAFACDIMRGPVYVPSLDLLFVKACDAPRSPDEYGALVRKLKISKTVRETVKTIPEPDIETSFKVNFGDRPLRMFAVAPVPSKVSLLVPDPFMRNQWQLFPWHITRNCHREENGTLGVSIWPFDKGAPARRDGNEGAAVIGAESELIIRTLLKTGFTEAARDAIDYWLYGERALPFFRFAEAMGDGALARPYNSFNRCAPGYDQKHTAGHGKILSLIADYYAFTADKEWLLKRADKITDACLAVKRLRAEMKKRLTPESRVYGLLPPCCSGDFGETRFNGFVNTSYAVGLSRCAKMLSEAGCPGAAEIAAEAAEFSGAVKNALLLSAALSPVRQVRDGTYRRFLGWQFMYDDREADIPWAPPKEYFDITMNGLHAVPYLISAEDPVVSDTLDVLEDTLMLHGGEDRSKSVHGNHYGGSDQSAFHVADMDLNTEQLLYSGGFGLQGGYERHKNIYLRLGESGSFIRALCNTYAVEAEPSMGYVFWEGPFRGGALDKSYEEAAFIECVRDMLVLEKDGVLALCQCIPAGWLSDGGTVSLSGAPTALGTVSFEISSELSRGRLRFRFLLDGVNSEKCRGVSLRLRLPDGKKVSGTDLGRQDGEYVVFRPEAGREYTAEMTVSG